MKSAAKPPHLLILYSFEGTLEDPLDFRMVAGEHSWPIHSKVLMQHSTYFTRRIEEATQVFMHAQAWTRDLD